MTELNSEKRNHSRIPIDNKFLLHLNGKEYCGYFSNISPGGLLLEEIEPKLSNTSVGQHGELFFHGNSNKQGIKCEIRHLGNSGVGVRFCET